MPACYVLAGQLRASPPHKIFNADWIVDGEKSDLSLFGMIRNTHKLNPEGTLSAYADNCGVIPGSTADWWEVDQMGSSKPYRKTPSQLDILCKVETRHHPTAISPSAPQRASVVKSVTKVPPALVVAQRLASLPSWFPISSTRLHSAMGKTYRRAPDPHGLTTRHHARRPNGGAAFGNEFGRPQLCGVFRTHS